ncbi:MAG: hypothetical protein ABIP94_12155 [Planctomycetota bacterium]
MPSEFSAQPDPTRRHRRLFALAGSTTLVAAVPLLFVLTTAFRGIRGAKEWAAQFWPLVAIGVAAMLVFLVVTTPLMASRCQRSPVLMAPHTLLSFAVGAAAASSANWLLHDAANAATDQVSGFGQPMYWLLLLGSAPALCTGGVVTLVYLWLDRKA